MTFLWTKKNQKDIVRNVKIVLFLFFLCGNHNCLVIKILQYILFCVLWKKYFFLILGEIF